MAKYVGKRIVPLPCGEWAQTREYEMLSVVLYAETDDSYMAKRQVPAGTAITDTAFWAKSSEWSQQVKNMSDQLTDTLRQMKADNDATEAAIKADNDATENAIRQDNTNTRQHVDESLADTTAELTGKVTTAVASLNEGKTQLSTTSAALTARLNSIVGSATGETEILDSRVDYENDAYENLGNAVRGADRKLKARIDSAFDDLANLNGIIQPPQFELGVVDFPDGGIEYKSSSARIRTKEGTSIRLKAGDIITADDWSQIFYFGGYKNANGDYHSFATRNSRYIMPEDGEFYLCARKADSSVIEDVDALAAHLLFIRPQNLSASVTELSERINQTNEVISEDEETIATLAERLADTDGSILLPKFEFGTLTVSSEGLDYYNSTARIRFKEGTALSVKAGDVVTSTDWHSIAILGGYKNHAGEYVGFNTRSSNYTMPEDGDLYICARNYDGTVIEDVDALASLLKVIRPNNLAKTVEGINAHLAVNDGTISDLQQKDDLHEGRLGTFDGNIALPPFELGGFSIVENEMTYYATSTRIRTAEGKLVSLKAGDIIVSTPGEIYYYGGYRKASGEYVQFNTRTSNYVMPEDGDFFMGARNPEGTVIEDVEALASLVSIFRPNNTLERVDTLEGRADAIDKRLDHLESEQLKANMLYHTGHIFRRAYNPYHQGGSLTLTGQLHCHISHKNDEGQIVYYGGNDTTTMQHYKDLGYDFLTMTNYGHMGVIYHPEEGSMPEGLTWLCDGQEAAINGSGNPNQSLFPCKHSCVYNTREAYPWMPEMEWQEWAEIAKKKGEIVTIAHPAWSSTYQQPEVLKKIKGGIRFCEIYNGACDSASKAGSQTSSGYPIYTLPEGKEIDYAWEILLDNGCVTWGTAVSDAHANNNLTVLANGCVKVFADHNERFEIMKNLCNGNFYASTNVAVSLNSITFEDGVLTIDTGDEGASTEFLKEGGEVLSTVTGSTVSYRMDGTEKYVRARITFPSGEMIWTQPIINLFSQDYDNYFDFNNI